MQDLPDSSSRMPGSGRHMPASTARRHAVRGSIIGNFIDQFDIFLPVIALAPAAAAMFGKDHLAAATGLIFIATLLGRPVGSLVFGPLADRYGRNRITQLALLGVAMTTLGIALIPSHHVIGVWALAVMVALRFLGGMFLAGEYSAAIPLALEWTEPRKRGLVSGLIMWMSPWANAVIAAITLGLYALLGPGRYAQWGWRITFMCGALLALGMYVYYRRNVSESPDWQTCATRHGSRLRDLLNKANGTAFMRVFVLMTGLWLMTNMAVVMLARELGRHPALDAQQVTYTMLWATAISAPAMLLCGHLSTIVGRQRFFMLFGMLSAVAAPVLFSAIFHATGLTAIILLAGALQVVTVAVYGPIGAHLVEQFPVSARSSGYGAGYSVSIVLPALYPYYLPPLQQAVGDIPAIVLLLLLAGVLVMIGGLLAGTSSANVTGNRLAMPT